MMTSTYILPDVVYKSSYEINFDVEIKSEPESDEDLYDSLAVSGPNVDENYSSQHCENDEGLKELEEEPLVEIDSITVPQDLVEDELEPTLLLYVNSEAPKCKLSKNNEIESSVNSDCTSTNKTPLKKPSENEIAERRSVTKALRSIKKKCYTLPNKAHELHKSQSNQEVSKIECETTTRSEQFTKGCQSSSFSSEKTSKFTNVSVEAKNRRSKNVIEESAKVLGTSSCTSKHINRNIGQQEQDNKTCLKTNCVSDQSPYLTSVNHSFCTRKRKPKSVCVSKSATEKKGGLITENKSKHILKKDMLVLNHPQNFEPSIAENNIKELGFNNSASNEESDKMETKLKPSSFDCPVCGKHFREKSHLATHSRAHVDIRNFKCNECGNSFKTKTNLLFHMKTHEEAPYVCKKCDKTFPERKVLMRHIRVVHSGEGKYNCGQCGRSFKCSQNLELHYTLHTGNKPFSCNICGKSFVYKMTFMTHMRAHAADEAFSCELCPSDTNKGELRRRCHHFSEAKPWLCTVCGKGYPLKATLKNHMKTHAPEKAFKCDECGKSFVKKHAYESHIRAHKGESPQFMCDQCSQSYFNVAALRRHYMKHTSERKFVCDICSKAFWTKDALKVHKRSHVSVKMFNCTQCSKSFAHKHTLIAHSKSHYNEQSFSCEACPKTFIHKYNLDRHERQHTINPVPPLPPPPHPSLTPSLIMMAPSKHLDFSTLHIL